MYILYIKEGCPFCNKVRHFISENGIEAELRDRAKGDHLKELIARGGKSQVPYLVDTETGVEMYESGDIIAHLKARMAE